MQLKNALDTGIVEPLKVENKEEGYRGPVMDCTTLLCQCCTELCQHSKDVKELLIDSGIALGAHSAFDLLLYGIIQSFKDWVKPERNIKVSLESSDGGGFVPRLSWRAKDTKDLRYNDKLLKKLCDNYCLEKNRALRSALSNRYIQSNSFSLLYSR